MKTFKSLLWVIMMLFMGCGGGGSTASQSDGDKEVEQQTMNGQVSDGDKEVEQQTINGQVIDAEISGATVFLDLNLNSNLDGDEPNTKTNADGSFSLMLTQSSIEHLNYLNQSAPVIAFGGTDIRTSEPFEDYLMAMTEGKSEVNITPISTLVAQTLQEEILIGSEKLFQKTTEDLIADLNSKIDAIKKNISALLDIREELLTENPIALAQQGDNTLLNTSLQLHKVAKEMKKAMKQEVRDLKKSILVSYRALGKVLKTLNKEALKSRDNALSEALETAMDDSEIFEKSLVQNVKIVSREIIKEINDFWTGQEVSFDDSNLTNVIRSLEVIVKATEINTSISTTDNSTSTTPTDTTETSTTDNSTSTTPTDTTETSTTDNPSTPIVDTTANYYAAKNNILSDLKENFEGFTVVVDSNVLVTSTSTGTIALYGNINGKSTNALFKLNTNYNNGDVFIVKVYDGETVVGESEKVLFTGGILEFSDITTH